MPTIHREHGLRFAIYTDDHEPAHVHAIGEGEAKIAIRGVDGLPSLSMPCA
jgi:histidinol phosphatase-like PHP family hydrolase